MELVKFKTPKLAIPVTQPGHKILIFRDSDTLPDGLVSLLSRYQPIACLDTAKANSELATIEHHFLVGAPSDKNKNVLKYSIPSFQLEAAKELQLTFYFSYPAYVLNEDYEVYKYDVKTKRTYHKQQNKWVTCPTFFELNNHQLTMDKTQFEKPVLYLNADVMTLCYQIEDGPVHQTGLTYYGPFPRRLNPPRFTLEKDNVKLSNQTSAPYYKICCEVNEAESIKKLISSETADSVFIEKVDGEHLHEDVFLRTLLNEPNGVTHFYRLVEIDAQGCYSQPSDLIGIDLVCDSSHVTNQLQIFQNGDWKTVRTFKPNVTTSISKPGRLKTVTNPLLETQKLTLNESDTSLSIKTFKSTHYVYLTIPNVINENHPISERLVLPFRVGSKLSSIESSYSETFYVGSLKVSIERIQLVKIQLDNNEERSRSVVSTVLKKEGRYDIYPVYEHVVKNPVTLRSPFGLMDADFQSETLTFEDQLKEGDSACYQVVITDAYGVEHVALERHIQI